MSLIAQTDLSELLLQLYSLHPGGTPQWDEFLRTLQRMTGSDGVALMTQDLRSGQALGTWVGYEAKEVNRFLDHYSRINPWMPKESPTLAAGGTVIPSESFLSMARLKKTEFYTDWGKQNEVVHSVGVNLGIESGFFRYLCLNRGDATGPAGDDVIELMRMLVPHLQNAVRIQGALAVLGDLRQALDSLQLPVFLVDRDAKVLEISTSAERLKEGKHLPIRIAADRTLTVRLQGGQGLPEAIASLPPDVPFHLVKTAAGRDRATVGFLGRAQFINHHSPHRYLFILLEPSAQSGIEAAAGFFRLTKAETHLVQTLLRVGSLDRTIEELEVSRNTVKKQIAAVFRKTGTNRQGQVIQLFSLLGRVTHLGENPS